MPLRKSRPPTTQDQEPKQNKKASVNAVEVDATHTQDKDSEFFNLIHASIISLSKQQIEQFLKAQVADTKTQNMSAQSESEIKRWHL